MTFGKPISVPRQATDAEREQLREKLQAVLVAGLRGD
jgi:hypothetical protein